MKTSTASDGQVRCHWCNATPEYLAYHDDEWGYPVDDDRRLFEKLSLEGFQSGLSWRTILAKRDNFRRGFHDFDIDRVARFTAQDVTRLLGDAGIVRHRGKIEAVISNAQRAGEVITRDGGLAAFFWGYEPGFKAGALARVQDLAELPPLSAAETSVKLSKDLKKQGWKFVGPITIYAFMQAMGMVNDHAVGCVIRTRVERARKTFKRPKTSAAST